MNAPLPIATAAADGCIDSRFAVPGMRCAGCIAKIERGLLAIPGVATARVNFSAKQVAVSHAPDLTEDRLLAAIEALGFESQRLADNPLGNDRGETDRLLRALAVAGFGMMNIMLLSVSVWAGAGGVIRELFHWLSALIAVPVIAYAARPFFASAAMALRHWRTNMDVPIAVGITLATGVSLYETATGGPHAYFDGTVMLIFFLLGGRVLDGMMRDRARDGISALLRQTAGGAMIVQADGTTLWTRSEDVASGMTMQVAAGETLVADGVVLAGTSSIDAAMLTGESDPQSVAPGEGVHAGTTNIAAPLLVRVTAAGQDSSIAAFARLMDDAGQHRSFHVRIADRAARLYAPAVHALALLTFAGWILAGAGVHQSLLIAVAVLIITCPCALGLAVPAAQVVASGALMRKGILVKDGSALERLAIADHVVFDKTGTLTQGQPVPVDLDALPMAHRQVALALAQVSRHPVSRGLRNALLAQGVHPAPIDDPREIPGEGVEAIWQGQPVRLGRTGQDGTSLAVALTLTESGAPLTRPIQLQDQLRPQALETVQALARQGLSASILSGDRAQAVAPIADALGLPARADARPQDKVAEIIRLEATGHKVLMVGDGLNDGPALAAAHVSIAPSSASDVGQQAADAVFTASSLMPVALAVQVARRTMTIVRQNFALAIGYNVLAVPLAVAGLVTPLIAALAMSLSSLIVVGNALRLYWSADQRRGR